MRNHPILKTAVLASLLLVISAPPLLAQTARDQAKAAFVEGRGHFAATRYAKALEAFKKANTLAPHPLMVFNIAQVYEAMEDLPSAIATYRTYLETSPNDAAEVEQKVAGLEATLAGWPTLRLETVPPGAEVRVGSVENPARGTTPLTLELPRTPQRIFVSLAGHETSERPVELSADSALTVALVPILPVLRVETRPAGARVLVDGEPAGSTPLTRPVAAGAHTIRVELEGFEPIERTVTLGPEHTKASPLPVEIELSKAIPRGELVLSVSPAGAEVLVDRELVGRAPLTEPLVLTEGLHTIEVRAPGAEPYTEMIAISAGQRAETSIDIGGGPDWSTIGIVTMGVGGALVAGGAVTGALALGASGDLDDCRADPSCARSAREVELADDVRSQALVTDVLIWSGVAVAAGGVVLYLLAPDEAGVEHSEIREQSWFVTPLQGGAAAGGRFEF